MYADTTAPPSVLRGRMLVFGLVAVALLAASPAAQAETVRVAPVKKALAQAYQRSDAGDVIRLSAGRHPAQTIPAGSKPVTLRAAASAKVPEIDNYADNVTFDGVDVDGGFAMNATFENHGAANVTFKNGRIGNVTDEKGAVITGPNFTFDNVVFHDVRVTGPEVHNECVYALDVTGMTVRNSLFHACATMDLFFTYGSWWSPLPPAYGSITLENNVFGHSTMEAASSWHYYSLYVANTANGGGTINGWTVRNNTFEIPANLEHAGSGGTRWVGNLGGWNCAAGITFRHNVGQKCSGSRQGGQPGVQHQDQHGPLRLDQPRRPELPPEGRARPPSTPPTRTTTRRSTATAWPARRAPGRRRARVRRAAPRRRGPAAARRRGQPLGLEAQAQAPAAGGGAAAAGDLQARRPAPRTSPGTVCPGVARCVSRSRAGRGCALQVRRVAAPRAGPRSCARRSLTVRRTRVIGIRARGLRRGRYRVVVRARTARVRSQPWSFRLLVR